MTNNQRFPGNDIDETAKIAEGVKMGTGNIIGPYCIIGYPPEWRDREYNYGKVIIGNNNRITGLVTIDSGAEHDTQIADGCYLMKHSHVGHDAVLSNRVTLSCGAKIGGHTIIGEDTTIGLNACIHQKLWIPSGCMIGMGAVITKRTEMAKDRKYAGNPAKDIGVNIKPVGKPIIDLKQMA